MSTSFPQPQPDPFQSQLAASNFQTQPLSTTQNFDTQKLGASSQAFGATNASQSFNAQATNQFGTSSSFQQYATSQSLQQQFGPLTSSTPVVDTNVTQSVPLNAQADFANSANFQPSQSTPIPQLVPKVTETTIGKKQTITEPVKHLGASTVQGQNTSRTLPVTYSKPTTTTGKVLPPIHSPPKVSQLPPQQQPGESRAPIFEKQIYKRNEINVDVPKKVERLPEQHKTNEVQGEPMAPIFQKQMILQPRQSGPITRPPQYEKASVKVIDVPVNGGILPQKFLSPRQLKPNITTIPPAQQITRKPVVLKENVINVGTLPPQFIPLRTLQPRDLGYNRSYDNVFASLNVNSSTTVQQGISATGASTVGDAFGAQGLGATGVQGSDVFGTQGSVVSSAGAQGFEASSGFQQTAATQFQSSSASYQVGPTTSYQQYFQSSSVSPGQVTVA